MINEVSQKHSLAIANKNNYGYISPGDFNLYCEQAQLISLKIIFINIIVGY